MAVGKVNVGSGNSNEYNFVSNGFTGGIYPNGQYLVAIGRYLYRIQRINTTPFRIELNKIDPMDNSVVFTKVLFPTNTTSELSLYDTFSIDNDLYITAYVGRQYLLSKINTDNGEIIWSADLTNSGFRKRDTFILQNRYYCVVEALTPNRLLSFDLETQTLMPPISFPDGGKRYYPMFNNADVGFFKQYISGTEQKLLSKFKIDIVNKTITKLSERTFEGVLISGAINQKGEYVVLNKVDGTSGYSKISKFSNTDTLLEVGVFETSAGITRANGFYILSKIGYTSNYSTYRKNPSISLLDVSNSIFEEKQFSVYKFNENNNYYSQEEVAVCKVGRLLVVYLTSRYNNIITDVNLYRVVLKKG